MKSLPKVLLEKANEERTKQIAELFKLLSAADKLQELASRHGIQDIFQDNGGKILQSLIVLGLTNSPGREGNDAVDSSGQEYELKTANVRLVSGFSTHHHLTHDILEKYRKVPWVFSFYEDIKLLEVWAMKPADLEHLFSHWEDKLDGRAMKKGVAQPKMTHINNPKIPFADVKSKGTVVLSSTEVEAFRKKAKS